MQRKNKHTLDLPIYYKINDKIYKYIKHLFVL